MLRLRRLELRDWFERYWEMLLRRHLRLALLLRWEKGVVVMLFAVERLHFPVEGQVPWVAMPSLLEVPSLPVFPRLLV